MEKLNTLIRILHKHLEKALCTRRFRISVRIHQIKETGVLSAFLTEKWQSQNFGRELVFSADLCYNGGSVKASLREGGGPR